MKGIIKELWQGNICPMEKNGVFDYESREKLLLLDKSEQQLTKEMTSEEKEQLEKHIELIDEMYSKLLADAFEQGYKIGSKLTLAIFS